MRIEPFQIVALMTSFPPERNSFTCQSLADAYKVNYSSMWRILLRMETQGLIKRHVMIERVEGGPPSVSYQCLLMKRPGL